MEVKVESVWTVEEALSNAAAIDGKEITLQGWLIADPHSNILAAHSPDDPHDCGKRIPIAAPELVDALFQKVFARVGTPYYYLDFATVHCKFIGHPTPRLTDLSYVIIHRPDETIRVDIAS